jgi:hypothetical protein
MTPALDALESLVLRDCGRGIETLAAQTRGNLRRAADALLTSSGVALVTGFGVQTAMGPAPETDGPIGAASLAALLDGVDRPWLVVTDGLNETACIAALQAFGLQGDRVRVADNEIGSMASELRSAGFDCLIFVERLGPNRSGRYLSMRGTDLTPITAPLDQLLGNSFHSIGIGDGGNEVGMGNLSHYEVLSSIEHGGEIHSIAMTDELILAGVSNWGAWALVGATALLSEAMATPADRALDIERWMTALNNLVDVGAVDGVLMSNVPSVDGFEPSIHTAVLTAVRAVSGLR